MSTGNLWRSVMLPRQADFVTEVELRALRWPDFRGY